MDNIDAKTTTNGFPSVTRLVVFACLFSFWAGAYVGPAIWKRYDNTSLIMAAFWGSLAVRQVIRIIREVKRLSSPFA
jgi:hypothetical protein